jgi:pyrroloquinoline quinone biosynthesis protein B
VDGREKMAIYLLDATPDIKFQLNLLAGLLPHPARAGRLRPPDAIFLTHAHMGHIGGLPQLGPDAMDARGLPLFASAGVMGVLEKTAVWQPFLQHIQPAILHDGIPVRLGDGLTITPITIPHRDEWGAGTFAFRVQGPTRSLLYLPDIDSWDAWPSARTVLGGVDVALVDACFYSTNELDGRTPVAHPLVRDTLARFADLPTKLLLTHLNHTNPLLTAVDLRQQLLAVGMDTAYTGMRIELG